MAERDWIEVCYLVFQLKFKVITIPTRWLNASYLIDCRIALSELLALYYSRKKRRKDWRCLTLPVLCRCHCCCFLVCHERKESKTCWTVADNMPDAPYIFYHFPNL